jgi:hypothetical protein
MKRRTLILCVVIVILCGCGGFEKEVLIPREKLQDMIDKKFPYQKNAVIAKIGLDTPLVYFREENVGLRINYSAQLLDKKVSGDIDFNGRIYYRQEKGAFYLKDFDIVDIEVDDSNFSDEKKIKSVLSEILNNYLKDYPVYRLDQKDFKQNLAKLLLKSVDIKGDNLSLVLSI